MLVYIKKKILIFFKNSSKGQLIRESMWYYYLYQLISCYKVTTKGAKNMNIKLSAYRYTNNFTACLVQNL